MTCKHNSQLGRVCALCVDEIAGENLHLKARVAELEAESSTLRLLLVEAQRTGTLPLDLNERINAARY